LRAGLKHEPEDLYANLGLAALLVKRADGPALDEAGRRLSSIGERLKNPGPNHPCADFHTTSAIYRALRGDRAAAQPHRQAALKQDPNNERARAVLLLIGP